MKAIILHDSLAQPEELAITMSHLINARIPVKLLDVAHASSADFQGVDWVILDCWMPDHNLPMSVQTILQRIPHDTLRKLRIIELPDLARAMWFHGQGKQLTPG